MTGGKTDSYLMDCNRSRKERKLGVGSLKYIGKKTNVLLFTNDLCVNSTEPNQEGYILTYTVGQWKDTKAIPADDRYRTQHISSAIIILYCYKCSPAVPLFLYILHIHSMNDFSLAICKPVIWLYPSARSAPLFSCRRPDD